MSKILNGLDYNGVDDNGTNTEYVWKTIDMGDWNMDTTAVLSVAHSLSATEWKTIINITAAVRDDTDTAYYPINQQYITAAAGIWYYGPTNVELARYTTGTFDSTSFDSTSYNRGYITFMYQPD